MKPSPLESSGKRRLALPLMTTLLVLVAPKVRALPDSEPLTLARVLEAVSAHSEAAETATLDRSIATEDVRQARALFLPTVEIEGGRVIRDHPVVAEFGTLQAPTSQASYWNGKLGISELLFDGGQRKAASAAAEGRLKATIHGGAATVQAAGVSAAAVYLDAVALMGRRTVLQERLRSLDAHLKVVQDMYDQGLVARNDVLETEVRRRTVADQSAAAEDDLAIALADLDRRMGLPPDGSASVPATLPPPPELPGTLEEITAETLQANSELKALEANVTALEAEVQARQRAFRPLLTAGVSHVYEQNRYLLYPNATVLDLSLSWEVFDGGTRDAALHRSEFALDRQKRQLTELRRSLKVDVERAYRSFGQSLRQAATARTNIEAAQENLRIEEDQYRAGLARTTDVLDAESTLAQSRFELVNQHVEAYLHEVEILAAAGRDLAGFYDQARAVGPDAGAGAAQ